MKFIITKGIHKLNNSHAFHTEPLLKVHAIMQHPQQPFTH